VPPNLPIVFNNTVIEVNDAINSCLGPKNPGKLQQPKKLEQFNSP
jgi:hypothetical protein